MKNSIIQKSKGFNTFDLLKYRNEIFGIAAIWIVLFHIYGNISFPIFAGSAIFAYILSIGNMGVDIFLVLSAFGLWHSMNKNTLKLFYVNRLKRVVLPFLLLAMPFFVIYDLILRQNGILNYFCDISTLNFWITGDHPTWYIAFIVPVYAVYPFLNKLDKKTNGWATFVLAVLSIILELILMRYNSVIYQNAERALSRTPVFLFSMCFAPKLFEKPRQISFLTAILSLVGFCILFLCVISGHIPLVITRYFYGIMAYFAIITYSYLRTLVDIKKLGKIIAWLGGISLEIYITHVFAIRIIKMFDLWDILPLIVWYFVFPIIIILLSKGLSFITKKTNSLFKK